MNKLKITHGLGFFLALAMAAPSQTTTAVNLSGTVTDSLGTPLASATVKLETMGISTTTGANGTFTLTGNSTAVFSTQGKSKVVALKAGQVFLEIPERSWVSLLAFDGRGQALGASSGWLDMGTRSLALPKISTGICFFKIRMPNHEVWIRALSIEGDYRNISIGLSSQSLPASLAKVSASALYDVLVVTKEGYQKAFVSLSTSDSSGMKIKMLKDGTTKFSFFITSQKSMQDLSKSSNGFGGDFRFGETGPGAGLRGADKLCATIAEKSLPGSSVKGWRAFLSVSADANGKQVDAITRIGQGPWYDRTGRLVAPTKADLLNTRPMNGDPTIQNDLPNEDGIPNHKPDPNLAAVDNHHVVTGSSTTGTLASATATCKDWTTSDGATANGKPMCGFAWPRGTTGNGSNWMSTFSASGCAPGYHFDNSGGQASASGNIIGSAGGYGAIYCFALNP